MNQLLTWLSSGDLRSDGISNEIVELILENDGLVDDLLMGFKHPNPVIRAHAADAVEKIARSKPDILVKHLPELIQSAQSDPTAMVKMHIAMTLGNLVVCDIDFSQITLVLKNFLDDESVFTRSWAIVSLCIVAKKKPEMHNEILTAISSLSLDQSPAIHSRLRKAIH